MGITISEMAIILSNMVACVMQPTPTHSQIVYFNDLATPLGKITTLGIISKGTGTDRATLRQYRSYAIVYFLDGTGQYRDANGFRRTIVTGDLVLVTPDLAHQYTTRPGHYWDECHISFEGPLFDLCRATGLLNESRPIIHLEPVQYWLGRMRAVIQSPSSQSISEKCAEITRLLSLLTDIFLDPDENAHATRSNAALYAAKSMLDANLEQELDLQQMAKDLGLTYETFRKGFRKVYGVAPAQYRAQRRMTAACHLLVTTNTTHERIAEYLGFADEFHFSKRFRQLVGMSPKEYRRQGVVSVHNHPSAAVDVSVHDR